ncbi:hypothetical protein D5086_016668 [Populus alba]|uniref:Uncharacterized protein n=1 Tax=Populus alba TaxID=43335 RepID=A0ACC4BWE8_POPAL
MCKNLPSLSEKSQLRILNRKLDALVDEIAHKIAGYYTRGLAVPSPDNVDEPASHLKLGCLGMLSISRNGLDSELGCQKEVGGSYFMSCDASSGSSCSISRNALDSELGCHE